MKSRLTREDLEFLCSVRGTDINRYGTGIEVHRVDISPEEKEMILDFRADKSRRELEEDEQTPYTKTSVKVQPKPQTNKKNALLEKLAEQYTEEELKALAKGYGLSAPVEYDDRVKVGKVGRHKIGVFTDTHIGSKYTNSQYIIDALKKFEDEGCEFILHAGDVVEGVSSRPGHAFECSHYGFDAQYKEAVRIFSQTDLKIYFVEGNHSAWVKNAVGADMGLHLNNSLPNMHYLGHDMAVMKIGSVDVMLWHGIDGNASYSVSYRVQKIIESLQGGTKPNILICGHTHKSFYLFERNIHAISAGCMQFQSAFMRGKRLSAHTGYWIIEFEERNGEVLSFTQTFYPLYK